MSSLIRRPLDAVRRQVFHSFHYENDCFRVQLIQNIGVIDGNSPCATPEWEAVKRGGDAAIKRWIDTNMSYRSCVIVMVGGLTATRKWVHYEINKAIGDGRGLFGIYVHNLHCARQRGMSVKGLNPFDYHERGGHRLSDLVPCYDPGVEAYDVIRAKMGTWVENAITAAR